MSKKILKDKNFIAIQSFMVNDLKLKGNELIIYAIIYGFSQDGENRFTGSLKYLSEWTSLSKQGVIKNLKSLVEKGYIEKVDKVINGVKFVEYYATDFNMVVKKVDHGGKKSLPWGGKKSLPNNIDIDNIYNNIDNNIVIEKQPAKRKSSRFVAPTVEEVKAYCDERNNGIDPNKFIDYYEARGWMLGKNHIKDWKACVRTWERNSYGNTTRQTKTNNNSKEVSYYDSNGNFDYDAYCKANGYND